MGHDADALRDVVERYLGALEQFDLDTALACFTDDVFYSHPPYGDGDNGGLRHEVSGHADLVKLFERRGHRPDVRHRVTRVAIDGDHGFVAGIYGERGSGTAGSFVSTVELAADGRIAHYAAYSSTPGVGAALSASTIGGITR